MRSFVRRLVVLKAGEEVVSNVPGCSYCYHAMNYAGRAKGACAHPEVMRNHPIGRWVPNPEYVPEWCPLARVCRRRLNGSA